MRAREQQAGYLLPGQRLVYRISIAEDGTRVPLASARIERVEITRGGMQGRGRLQVRVYLVNDRVECFAHDAIVQVERQRQRQRRNTRQKKTVRRQGNVLYGTFRRTS